MKTFKLFDTQEKPDASLLEYDAGLVHKSGDEFLSLSNKLEPKKLSV